MSQENGLTRRKLLASSGLGLGATLLFAEPRSAEAADRPGAKRAQKGAAATGPAQADQRSLPPGRPHKDYRPVVVPNGYKLPWKIVNGVKVFHLVAEEVEQEFAPGLKATCWGYNGRVHGPLIEAVALDRVRIYVTNRLKAATS